MLSTKDPYLVQGNDDLTWAQIVAGYDTPTTTAVAPWPVYEDVDAAATDESEAPTALLPQPEPLGADAADSSGSRTAVPASRSRPRRTGSCRPSHRRCRASAPADQLGWLGLIGGPVVLVAAAVFSLALPSWVTLFAALGFIAGFVSLVVRMDNGEDRFDDPDNGAQV